MGPPGGIRVVEFSRLGTGPFAAMLFSDMGAQVMRVERRDAREPQATEVTRRY
jgi:alpha-methylacyl-CoA racemase